MKQARELTFARPQPPFKVRLANWAGVALGRLGVAPERASLSPSSVLAAAERRTGLSDFGAPYFQEGLRVLLDAYEHDSHLHFYGRIYRRNHCVHNLTNRLYVAEDVKRNPAIAETPVPRPMFILGLPRSGSTLLHNILSQDRKFRAPTLWEVVTPSPPPGASDADAARIALTRRWLAEFQYLAPKLSSVHEMTVDGPDECHRLLMNTFTHMIFGVRNDVDRYSAWLEHRDMVPSYRDHKQQLQVLLHRRPGEQLLLKCPHHLWYLDALLEVYPDARIIQLHRDPVDSLPSFSSLSSIVHGMSSERIDLRRIGRYWSEQYLLGVTRMLAVRSSAKASSFHDVRYADLLRDPIAAVRQLYAAFGEALSAEAEARMRRYLAESPQHKHGKHEYSLEQFGLDAAPLRASFAPYYERFGVRAE